MPERIVKSCNPRPLAKLQSMSGASPRVQYNTRRVRTQRRNARTATQSHDCNAAAQSEPSIGYSSVVVTYTLFSNVYLRKHFAALDLRKSKAASLLSHMATL
jgi:hypothetical protein